MIDRIVVQCLTRTESLRWVEILRQQIKCARTSTALNNSIGASLQQQQAQLPTPPPGLPPHVSPPFVYLTFWIRDALEDGRLSISNIKNLTNPKSQLDQELRPLSPWRYRRLRNEMIIESSSNTKREALIDEDEIQGVQDGIVENDEEGEENPYGYIRYMNSNSPDFGNAGSDDEITFLLPSPNVSSANASFCSSTESTPPYGSPCTTIRGGSSSPNTMLDSLRKLPTVHNLKELRITSLTAEEDIVGNENHHHHHMDNFFDQQFLLQPPPPSRLVSCPPEFKDRKSQTGSFIEFIDRTPSQTSLALPYCPPVQVDYDDFEQVWKNGQDWSVMISDQNLTQLLNSELEIMPAVNQDEYNRPIPSPAVPLRKKKSFITSQEIEILKKIESFEKNDDPSTQTSNGSIVRNNSSLQSKSTTQGVSKNSTTENKSEIHSGAPEYYNCSPPTPTNTPVLQRISAPQIESEAAIQGAPKLKSTPTSTANYTVQCTPASETSKDVSKAKSTFQSTKPRDSSLCIIKGGPFSSSKSQKITTKVDDPKSQYYLQNHSNFNKTKKCGKTNTKTYYHHQNQILVPPTRNKTYRVEIQARISPPKDSATELLNRDTPDLIRNLDSNTKPNRSESTRTWIQCQEMCYSTKTIGSEDESLEPFEIGQDNLVDEFDLPMSSLSKDDDQGNEDIDKPTQFKTAIYAHWWMKANLQEPILLPAPLDPDIRSVYLNSRYPAANLEEHPPHGHLGTWI